MASEEKLMEREPVLRESLPPPRSQRPRGGPSRGLLITCIIVLPLAALLLIGYLPRRERLRELVTASEKEEHSLPVVNTARVRRGTPGSELVLPGNIQAITDAPIYARADG